MNMNLHLDLEVDVLLWTPHMQLSHPGLSPVPSPSLREVGDRLSSTRLRLSKFLESLGLGVGGGVPGFPNATPPPQALTRWLWIQGTGTEWHPLARSLRLSGV